MSFYFFRRLKMFRKARDCGQSVVTAVQLSIYENFMTDVFSNSLVSDDRDFFILVYESRYRLFQCRLVDELAVETLSRDLGLGKYVHLLDT